jgi:hypothetical protein
VATQAASEQARRDAQIALIERHHQSQSDLAARAIAARRDAAMMEAEDRRRQLQAIINAAPGSAEAQLARLELAAVEKGLQNFLLGLEDISYRHRVRLDHQRAAQIAQAYAASSQGTCGRLGLVRQLLDVAKRRKASDRDRLQADMRRLEEDNKAQVGAAVRTAGRIRQSLAAVDRETTSLRPRCGRPPRRCSAQRAVKS